jgi:hypothetical protein
MGVLYRMQRKQEFLLKQSNKNIKEKENEEDNEAYFCQTQRKCYFGTLFSASELCVPPFVTVKDAGLRVT